MPPGVPTRDRRVADAASAAYGSADRAGVRRETATRAPRLSRFHVIGLAALGSLASLATAAALLDSGRSTRLVIAVLVATVVTGALVAGALAHAARTRTMQSLRTEFVAAWEGPTGGWRFFVAGCLVALPVVSFQSRILVGDSDSSWLLASILHVQREGVGYLTDTQQVLLPHLILGPVVSLGGIPALQAFNMLSVIALAGVVAFLAWRITGSTVGALTAALALTSIRPILERATLAPMYPTVLALGFLGLYFAYRAATAEERAPRWRAAVLAAICLIGSIEAHQIGQLFVVLSALLLVAVPLRRAAVGLASVYLCLAVLYLPRALINFAEGGFRHFFENRVEYWITKDYLIWIQTEMFHYPSDLSLAQYLEKLPRGLLDAWGTAGWLTLGLGLASLLLAPARLRRFIVACTLVLLAVVIHFQIPLFPRYLSLFLVGSALAAGVTIGALTRRPTFTWRSTAAVATAGLIVASAVSYHVELGHFRTAQAAVLHGPYRELAQEIRPREGVVGTRSFYLNQTSTNPSAYGGQFLSESEYRTLLTWPSDAAVIELMRRRDAAWLLVPQGQATWVARYNDIWLSRAYGEHARYPREVARSPSFCLVRRVRGASLYWLKTSPEVRRPLPCGRA